MSETNKTERPNGKAYAQPRLIHYGSIRELTKGGTGPMSEVFDPGILPWRQVMS